MRLDKGVGLNDCGHVAQLGEHARGVPEGEETLREVKQNEQAGKGELDWVLSRREVPDVQQDVLVGVDSGIGAWHGHRVKPASTTVNCRALPSPATPVVVKFRRFQR